jgi:hypothetical protein
MKRLREKVEKDILPKAGGGQWGTDELKNNYLKGTPGQKIARFKEYKRHK